MITLSNNCFSKFIHQFKTEEVNMNTLKLVLKLSAITALTMSWLPSTTADDTEIYQSAAAATATGRPKVLIIFDDSGSMRTELTTQLASYDPNQTYTGSWDSDKLYFSSGDAEDADNDDYFPLAANRCASSFGPLANGGFYQGKFQRASTRTRRGNTSYRWSNLNRDSNSTQNATYVDCQDDVTEPNIGNGPNLVDGYPCEDSPGDVNNWYCSSPDRNIDWPRGSTIIMTGNYLNWFNSVGSVTRTRLDIAKDTVNSIIDANPSIDFGLMTFNRNVSGNNGGRVINRIVENSDQAYRDQIKARVNAFIHDGNTPLCETTYEAFRYLTGATVYYGDDRETTIDVPARDLSAETSGRYISPTTDCAYTYVILMTDGEPVSDTAADNQVEALIGRSCSGSCLDELAEYMANTDLDGDSTNGNQFAITYTIGFATNQTLLSDTAAKGKGKYYQAESATELAAAFQSAITEILGTNESFTSPAVAVDTFSRTESRNEVFFAMFEPSDRVNWKGNIKRLNLVIQNGEAVLKDANNELAFNSLTGRIAETAQTVWSSSPDGDRVDQGGVGELLKNRNPATRNIYSDIGENGALAEFNTTNLTPEALGVADNDAMYSLFGASNETEFNNIVAWARGFDLDDDDGDGSITDGRWILADMLHSRPLVINYGALGSHTESDPEQRLVVGTNGGFLHMFDVETGLEDWAFTPKDLAAIHDERWDNIASTDHIYGLDAPPSLYTSDGGDGTITAANGDKAYIYFGQRRGGRNIYAMDISNPDSPSFMWQISGGTGAFTELGQTWSVPVVTKIPGYKYDHDNDGDTPMVPKPVLIFGAGYDTNKDSFSIGTDDSMGRGIFVVDAFTGALVWSVTPAANSATNLQASGLTNSVPGNVTVLDSNSDEITDRIYFADTGGNLWRVDMPGDSLPTSSQDTWQITHFASVNGGTTATDRRFFSAPDVVRTRQKVCTEFYPSPAEDVCKTLTTINFDAVLIGTGDRTNPNATDVDNQFYMFRDEQIAVYDDEPMTETECTAALADDDIAVDFRCNLPLTPSDLYDATANQIQVGTDAQVTAASSALENAYGWLINLNNNGEKSLARSITLFGSVFFTTYTPSDGLITSCQPQSGTGRLYQVDIIDARAKRDFVNNDGILDRSTKLGTLIPDTPSPHFGSDKKIRLLFPSGGGLLSGNPLDTGAQLPQPYGIYWYREEF
jgi:type IV pilus assembly protein PilY1